MAGAEELFAALLRRTRSGGVELLGRTEDVDLVERVRAHLAAERANELARLQRPTRLRPRLRPVPDPTDDGPPAA